MQGHDTTWNEIGKKGQRVSKIDEKRLDSSQPSELSNWPSKLDELPMRSWILPNTQVKGSMDVDELVSLGSSWRLTDHENSERNNLLLSLLENTMMQSIKKARGIFNGQLIEEVRQAQYRSTNRKGEDKRLNVTLNSIGKHDPARQILQKVLVEV